MLRYPEAPPPGRSRFGVRHPCGFPLASMQVKRPSHIPAGTSPRRLGRASDRHLATRNRLSNDPSIAGRARPVPSGMAWPGPIPVPTAFLGFCPSQSCSGHRVAARFREAQPTCHCPARAHPGGFVRGNGRRFRSVLGLTVIHGLGAGLLGIPDAKLCPPIGIGRANPALGFSSSRFSDTRVPLAFLRAFSHAPAGSRHLGRSPASGYRFRSHPLMSLARGGRSAACCGG